LADGTEYHAAVNVEDTQQNMGHSLANTERILLKTNGANKTALDIFE